MILEINVLLLFELEALVNLKLLLNLLAVQPVIDQSADKVSLLYLNEILPELALSSLVIFKSEPPLFMLYFKLENLVA